MYVVTKPVTCEFDGVRINQDYHILMSDVLVGKTTGITKNYGLGEGSAAQVLNDIYGYFGFNPFRPGGSYLYTDSADYTDNDIEAWIKTWWALLHIDIGYMPNSGVSRRFDNFKTMDDKSFTPYFISTNQIPGLIVSTQNVGSYALGIGSITIIGTGVNSITLRFGVAPQRTYDHGEWDPVAAQGSRNFTVRLAVNDKNDPINPYKVNTLEITTASSDMQYVVRAFSTSKDDSEIISNTNPYLSAGGAAGIGGGDGDYIDPTETTKIEFPDVPNIDAISSGLVTVYAPSQAQINALGGFLWGINFDISDLKKLFADPMSAIIGLSIVPVTPTLGGTKTVHFGDVDTGVTMPWVSNQFQTVDMGSVAVSKQVGCFMDYAPYTKIEIFLPGIGTRTLNADDCMGSTLTLRYYVDVVSGACIACISVGNKGCIYQFSGSLITTIPVTAANYSGAIQNGIQLGVSAGMTAVGAMSGAAPLTMAGISGLASNAANTAMNNKPQVEHSGNVCGASGLMGVKKPYLIITRPRMSVPNNLNTFTGNMLNMTCKLSQIQGFTMVEMIHLDGIPCTESERKELESILNKGVIF